MTAPAQTPKNYVKVPNNGSTTATSKVTKVQVKNPKTASSKGNDDEPPTFAIHCMMLLVSTFALWMFIVMFTSIAPFRGSDDAKSIQININEVLLKNDNTKEKCAPKPKPVEPKTSETGNGTRVLVYDGKDKYVTWPDPPPKDDLASVARYVMHISEFGSLATASTHKGIEGYPFANVFSVSDGPYDNSTGVPYFYFTPIELSVIDLKANNKASLTVTEAQSDYCNKKGYDPEDPRCAHAIFTGTIKKIEKGSEEKFARNALFSRHVEMSTWPADHDWFFAKMEIEHIYLLDFFGGAEIIDVKEYFASNPFGKKKKE